MTQGRATVVDEEAFARDWVSDRSRTWIAEQHRIGVTTATDIAKRLGLPQKKRGGVYRALPCQSSPAVLKDGEWAVDARGVMRWVACA